ncbi:hypothetical protein [Simplicispira psychrophila]|uniref:hypothetical protein n=1 Tax=Simplicispira psychrophila TaxID=80882 RepID=UPI00068F3691|nr:hypothetical protein [Simplicispira psychrophila]
MWQDVAVGAVVVLAGVYALWYWMPAALRKRLGAVRPALGKSPSCGSCSSCGGCGPTKKGPAADGLKAPAPDAIQVHKSA